MADLLGAAACGAEHTDAEVERLRAHSVLVWREREDVDLRVPEEWPS